MVKLYLFILSFLFSLFSNGLVSAQEQPGFTYNFNIYNGLPSNHIYGVITDRHGYLWIATEKGVVKYNGYDFKLFTSADGLPTNDVWQLIEDKKGRIWLGNISDEFGYIYDDKYHRAYLNGPNRTVYPRDIRTYGNGIIFFSAYLNDNAYPSICIEKNDTLYNDSTSKGIFNKYPEINDYSLKGNYTANNGIWIFIDHVGQPYIIHKSHLFSILPTSTGNNVNKIAKIDHDFFEKIICESNRAFQIEGKYLVAYLTKINEPALYTLNLINGKTVKLNLSKYCAINNIEYITHDQKHELFYVVAKDNILKFVL